MSSNIIGTDQSTIADPSGHEASDPEVPPPHRPAPPHEPPVPLRPDPGEPAPILPDPLPERPERHRPDVGRQGASVSPERLRRAA